MKTKNGSEDWVAAIEAIKRLGLKFDLEKKMQEQPRKKKQVPDIKTEPAKNEVKKGL